MDTAQKNGNCFVQNGFERLYIETPLMRSYVLSNKLGCNVFLKMEALQPSASFKLRGISYMIQQAVKQGCQKLVSSSGGNAGLAAAYVARKLNLPITIVVPVTTGQRMIDRLQGEGATVIQEGSVWNESDQVAHRLAQDPDCAYIHPFDHPHIWEGHSTMADEMLAQMEGVTPDLVVVAAGGAGMYCGVAHGMNRVGWENVPILVMETEGANCFQEALKAGKPVSIPKINSVAKSLGSLIVADEAFKLAKERPTIVETVSDQQALSAVISFLDDHRMLVEPACGAALASVYSGIIEKLISAKTLGKLENVVVIVCGGFGVTMTEMDEWMRKTGMKS